MNRRRIQDRPHQTPHLIIGRLSLIGSSIAFALAAVFVATALGPTARAQPGCWPSATPLGALPPAVPVWCKTAGAGRATFVQGNNSWVDGFDHGLADAELGAGYLAFENQGSSIYRSQHFRHNNHWMVDVAGQDRTPGDGPWNFGGAMMRPNRSFQFQNGKLVIEADVAAGVEEYGGQAWPEIVVTTAPAPTGDNVDGLYGYGIFGGHWTVGIRLQPSRVPIAAMYDDTGRGAGAGGRTFEVSFWQHEGAREVFGGGPYNGLEQAWRVCRGTDPDEHCRDRFRWELARDTLTLFVNGVKYMEHRGLPPSKQLPAALLGGEVYVYFASWIYKPDADTVRFHWDRIAVNPDGAGPPRRAPRRRPAGRHHG